MKKTRLAFIVTGLIALFGLIWVVIREIFKGRIWDEQLKDLKKGLKEEKKQNQEVIKKAEENIKMQDEIIKKKTLEIKNMTMNEQFELAKKIGLAE